MKFHFPGNFMYGRQCLEQYTWAGPNPEKGGAQFHTKIHHVAELLARTHARTHSEGIRTTGDK